MNRWLFFSLALSLNLSAAELKGPLGDYWEDENVLTIKEDKTPLFLSSDVYIKNERVHINRSIVTNGFALTIKARELTISPDVEIRTFRGPQQSIRFIDTTLRNTMPSGASCSYTGLAANEIGATGPQGEKGLDGHPDPKPIKVFATLINGKLSVNGNGQEGGKGGKGGMGGRGLKGCPGRDGDVSCSGVLGWGEGDERDGKKGYYGAMGGIGGKGGHGGKGGLNALLEVKYLNLLDSESVTLISEAGKAGEGGDPGDNGLSGSPGPGGGGKTKTCGMWPNQKKKKAHPGPSGDVRNRKESKSAFNARRGEQGEPGEFIKDSAFLTTYEELKRERSLVLRSVMDFHFYRFFYQLTQQSILLTLNYEDSGLALINEAIKARLLRDWTEGFIKPVQKDKKASRDLHQALQEAKVMAGLLEKLNHESHEKVRVGFDELLNRQRFILGQKVQKIAQSCHSFISYDVSQLGEPSELFSIPLCQSLQNLNSNPMTKIIVSDHVGLKIAGLNRDFFTYGPLASSVREPSSNFEIIVVNNRKFGEKHFKELFSMDEKESGTLGSLRALSPIESALLTENTMGTYIRLLKAGMQK